MHTCRCDKIRKKSLIFHKLLYRYIFVHKTIAHLLQMVQTYVLHDLLTLFRTFLRTSAFVMPCYYILIPLSNFNFHY